MPAKNTARFDAEGAFVHVFNKGIERRMIFNNNEDYNAFLGFLDDYLSSPKDSESVKTNFVVNGRTFRGTPHLPKNYFNTLELVAFSLVPDHFHLIIHQRERGSLEKFIRSLCTRYAIYYNKKYGRAGALFEGPYKSVQIKPGEELLHLSSYLHKANGVTSYPEYIGTRSTSWIKPADVLASNGLDKIEYKKFVERYVLGPQEAEILSKLILEADFSHLERSILASEKKETKKSSPENQETNTIGMKVHSNVPHFVAIFTAMFILLLTVGLGNTALATGTLPNFSSLPSVLGVFEKNTEVLDQKPVEKVEKVEQSPTPEEIVKDEVATESADVAPVVEELPKQFVQVVIEDGSKTVNIRQKPSMYSTKLGEATNGERFEYLNKEAGFYQVKLEDGTVGYIASNYIVVEGTSN